MKSLRKAMKIPIGIPAPSFITKIGAKYIFRTDSELALFGRFVRSEKLEIEGFEFKFPTIDEALKDLI